jgi:hypothetical protein
VALYNVLFDIAARTAKFEEGMTRVDRRLENMQRKAGALTKNLAGVFAIGGIAMFIKNTAAAADEVIKLAERTGRSVESISQLQFVAERSNVAIETLTKAQDQLAKRLGATDEEGKTAVKALNEIGLSAKQLRAVGLDEQLNLVADAMGKELDNVLRGGAGGIRELREESDRLGATMNELTAKHLAELDDQVERIGMQFKTAKAELVGLFSTPIEAYLDTLIKGFRGWQVMLGVNISEVEELNRKIVTLTEERTRLLRIEKEAGEVAARQRAGGRIEAINREMELLREQQEAWLAMPRLMAKYEADVARIEAKQNDAAEAEQALLAAAKTAAEERAKAYAKWREELTEIIKIEKMMNELEVKYPTPILDKNEMEAVNRETAKMIEDQAEKSTKVFESLYKQNEKAFSESMSTLSIFAEQGARNIQTYFADFLFDPFDKGIKGMLRGFIDVIRRMIAEAAAANILSYLGFGGAGGGLLGKGLGALFGGFKGFGGIGGGGGGGGRGVPTRAGGGPVEAGQIYRVNEKRMEFFKPAVSGRVVPLKASADQEDDRDAGKQVSVNFAPVFNIDARGATMDAFVALRRAMKDSNRELEVQIVERIRRGVYDFG